MLTAFFPVGTCLVVSLVGPLAMIGCEPRQARKGAAVTADSCAGVWLARGTSKQVRKI